MAVILIIDDEEFIREEISLHVQRTVDDRDAKEKQGIPVAVDTGGIIGQSSGIKRCIGHRASGIGHRASGIGHRASGIGHWALGIAGQCFMVDNI